jgi:hypothetical protein
MPANDANLVELQRQALQVAFDARTSTAERNRCGQFATPYPVAVEIARYVSHIVRDRLLTIRFADPALGTGSFFSAVLAVFGAERITSAVGVEIDPALCDVARTLWASSGLEVVQGILPGSSTMFTDQLRPISSWPTLRMCAIITSVAKKKNGCVR